MNGWLSMSPTVPPISVMITSGPVRRRPRLGLQPHPALDLVGDVRDDLHGVAEVLAAALPRDDRRVDLAGGDVRGLVEVDVEEALVVADVEVGLGAVIGDEHLAVLERVHRARIDVQIGVELLHDDAQSARGEQIAEAGGREALAERGDDAPGDEDVLGNDEPGLTTTGFQLIPATGVPLGHARAHRRRQRSQRPWAASSSSRAWARRRLGVRRAPQQPRHLGRAVLGVDEPHAARGDRAVAALLDDEVVVREGGDLGEVGDDDDLRRLRRGARAGGRSRSRSRRRPRHPPRRRRTSAPDRCRRSRPRSRASRATARRRMRRVPSGRGSAPACGCSRIATWSRPVERELAPASTSIVRRASGIARARELGLTAAARRRGRVACALR